MSFPETRLTLIQRLASGGAAEDWQDFLGHYWGPVCRFALRSGAGQLNDAEDVAGQTFEVLWENRLLVRWMAHRTARLRSLLCSVTRKILANRHRVRAGRDRLARDAAECWAQSGVTEDQQVQVFYSAWVEDLLRQAVELIAARYYQEAKGDYVRVLYGRLCQGLSIAQLATALDIRPSAVDNYFRHARQQLADALQTLLRQHIECYTAPDESEQEFQTEWQQMGVYLTDHGGLEEVVRRTYELMDPVSPQRNQQAGLRVATLRIASLVQSKSPPPRSILACVRAVDGCRLLLCEPLTSPTGTVPNNQPQQGAADSPPNPSRRRSGLSWLASRNGRRPRCCLLRPPRAPPTFTSASISWPRWMATV